MKSVERGTYASNHPDTGLNFTKRDLCNQRRKY